LNFTLFCFGNVFFLRASRSAIAVRTRR
jgi:hypothetical protein